MKLAKIIAAFLVGGTLALLLYHALWVAYDCTTILGTQVCQ